MNEKYNYWLKLTENDPVLFDELKSVENNDAEIDDRFYKDLEFGTAGIRGVLGAGTNRINVFVVRRATCAVAKYLLAKYENPSLAIAYDSRRFSYEFAKAAAEVLAQNGVKVFIFRELMPVPLLSFAVRTLKTSAGIVITASHNPKEYNGYKLYNEEGCQIDNSTASAVQKLIEETDFHEIDVMPFAEGLENGAIEYVSDDVVEAFLRRIENYSLSDGGVIDLKVVYSPLNGTGNKPVREILGRIGVNNVIVVKEQELPDPDFTTCPYPNPELKETLSLACEVCRRENADLMLATDPDCDRVGAAVFHNGELTLVSGNEMGILLLNYVLERRQEKGILSPEPYLIKSLVSAVMAEKIIEDYGGTCYNVFTGFRFIGELISKIEKEGRGKDMILAFEESCGYLFGPYIRDKDGVGASMMIVEMTDYYKKKGLDLIDVLEGLYEKYGYYKSDTVALSFSGREGIDKMRGRIALLREEPFARLGAEKVEKVTDYMAGVDGFEKMDVIVFNSLHTTAIVRPSGTEPKLKLYVHAFDSSHNKCESRIETMKSQLLDFFK